MSLGACHRSAVALVTLLTLLSAGGRTAVASPESPVSPASAGMRVLELPDGWPRPPRVSASSYLLLDAESRQVLAHRAAELARPVASTVKILTALTVLRHASVEEVVTVPEEAVGVGGASVGLQVGQRWSVRDLLAAVMVRSGNDAATALAVHVAGSVAGFVELMRQEAASLGLADLQLVSASGLDDRNRLSARDLATITHAAMRDPRFRALAAKTQMELPGGGVAGTRNLLLGSYPGANGVKTGFTQAAGYALVASAQRGERELIAVVLDADGPEARFADASTLLDFGFERFEATSVTYQATLQLAGGRAALRAGSARVTVPTRAPVPAVRVPLPVEVPDDGTRLAGTVTWHGETLASIEVEVDVPPRPGADGAAALGRFAVDRAYAAMRAATTTGAWRPAGPRVR